jgi:hypothetical protein
MGCGTSTSIKPTAAASLENSEANVQDESFSNTRRHSPVYFGGMAKMLSVNGRNKTFLESFRKSPYKKETSLDMGSPKSTWIQCLSSGTSSRTKINQKFSIALVFNSTRTFEVHPEAYNNYADQDEHALVGRSHEIDDQVKDLLRRSAKYRQNKTTSEEIIKSATLIPFSI